MTLEELNTQLYKKLFEEQKQFRSKLSGMKPQEILDNAYEYVIREDMLISLEYNDLTEKQCKTLLKTPTPLAKMFAKWENYEGDHMDEILSVIKAYADEKALADHLTSKRDAR